MCDFNNVHLYVQPYLQKVDIVFSAQGLNKLNILCFITVVSQDTKMSLTPKKKRIQIRPIQNYHSRKKTVPSLSLLIPVFSLKIDNFTFIVRKTPNRLNKNVMNTEGHLKCWWMPMDDIVQLSIVSISNINTANKSFTRLVITATFDNFFSYWDNTAWLMSLSIS